MSKNIEQPIIMKKSYSISKIKNLIDLNHDMINFKVVFNITSPEKHQFKALVVNQSTLDTVDSSQLEYKTVDGELSGEIIADKNVYQNYYIILKSDVPMSVDVELQTTKLPDYIEKNKPNTQKQDNYQSVNFQNIDNKYYILIGLVAIIIIYFIMNHSGDKSKGNYLPQSGMNQSLLAKLKKIPLE